MGRTVRVRQLRTSQQECAVALVSQGRSRLAWRMRWSLIGSRARRSTIPISELHRPMTLYFEQANIIAAVVCSLIVAGLLKGTIGVGMPVVALPLLSLFIDVKSAAMLLSMPLIFSN